jgi:putative sterol carrier protein
VDPIWIDVASGYSLLGSSEKIRKELGWQPRFPTTGDVLRRLSGRPNALASHAAKTFLGRLVRLSWLLRGLRPGRDAPAETRQMETSVNLRLTGERPGAWHFRLGGGRLFVRPGLDDAARATITLGDRTFDDLLSGRLAVSTATMTGKVRMRGDGEMGFLLGGLVGGFHALRDAKGLRGWPLRRFARSVLRDVERSDPPRPLDPTDPEAA